ncbi:hypothetical protein C8R45DRAFT_969115 [Mycena sanguinolenta]|nr:hypothetical protein C8R45DRAFT_969115 [Mycena sanguinolenta]
MHGARRLLLDSMVIFTRSPQLHSHLMASGLSLAHTTTQCVYGMQRAGMWVLTPSKLSLRKITVPVHGFSPLTIPILPPIGKFSKAGFAVVHRNCWSGFQIPFGKDFGHHTTPWSLADSRLHLSLTNSCMVQNGCTVTVAMLLNNEQISSPL